LKKKYSPQRVSSNEKYSEKKEENPLRSYREICKSPMKVPKFEIPKFEKIPVTHLMKIDSQQYSQKKKTPKTL
jgi:hypothetical protein